jgi:hypothetical protein
MKLPRLSIRLLMAIIGVVALNLAIARVLWNTDSQLSDLLPCLGLNAVVTQLAVFFLLRSRNGARPFWIGFVASSAIAAVSCSCAFLEFESVNSESFNSDAWYEYISFVQEFTGVVIFQTGFTIHTGSPVPPGPFDAFFDFLEAVKIASVFYAPQFVFAMSGGALTVLLARVARLVHDRRLPLPAVSGSSAYISMKVE